MRKLCRKCLIEKDTSLFGKWVRTADGLNTICKACNAAHSNAYYKQNLEVVRLKENKRRNENRDRINLLQRVRRKSNLIPYRERERKYKYANEEQRRLTRARYFQKHKEEVRVARKDAVRKHIALYPERYKARSAVAIAVTSGRLQRIKSLLCVDCNKPAARYDHYLGYSREHWLHVQPVCIRCDGLRERARGKRRICS